MKKLIPVTLIAIIYCIAAPVFAGLTAKEYTPSAIEVTVGVALDSMRQTDQPIQAQISYLRQIRQTHPDNTVIHRLYQDVMRGDSVDALRQEYEKLAEDDPTNAVYDYLNARIARTPEDRWRWAAKAVATESIRNRQFSTHRVRESRPTLRHQGRTGKGNSNVPAGCGMRA